MGYKDPKAESIELTTSASVQQIGQALQQICGRLKASTDQLQSAAGALDAFDSRCDIEIVAHGKANILSKQEWAVQIYVTDRGSDRHINLIALGHSGFAKVMHGSHGALKMSASIAKRDEIANALRF